MSEYYTIRWLDGAVSMLDQRLLPHQEKYCKFTDYRDVAAAIKDMVIRGAPAIGAAAGFGMALVAYHSNSKCTEDFLVELNQAAKILSLARPTAVNLRWVLDRILGEISQHQGEDYIALKKIVIDAAITIAEQDVLINKQIGKNGATLLPDGANIIHHCNTGALATVGYGTALGVIRYAHESGKRVHVYVDETRPRLQGARLTAWELKKLNIPHTVIVDGASGHIMHTQKIDLCLVGCDRIAANGDVANKIGTYNLSLVAFAHEVPFFAVGPISTIDLSMRSGNDIPIEERCDEEITHIGETQITPIGVHVLNPAFDVTPAKYISGIVTERGIVKSPYIEGLKKISYQGA